MKTVFSILAGIVMDVIVALLFTICIVIPFVYFEFGFEFEQLCKVFVWSTIIIMLLSPFGKELAKDIRSEE